MSTMATVEIELYGGPGDGMTIRIPEDAESWELQMPAMSRNEFIALESGAPIPTQGVPQVAHHYVKSHYIGRSSGKRIFTYAGPARARGAQ